MNIRKLIRSFLFTPFKSADDLWRKRARWGEINEFFKWQVFSSDESGYNPPFLSNPMNASKQQETWVKRTDDRYDFPEPERQEQSLKNFEFVYSMVKDRIAKDDVIYDVGINAGAKAEEFYNRGYTNLWGIDPMTSAIELGRKKRPYVNFIEGFFGDPKNDVVCDLLVCFGSIFRIPYGARLFDAMDRCASKYIVIWVQEAIDDFNRDLHLGLAKKGFICIEKRVVQPDTYIPIGFEGADGPMLAPGNRETGTPSQRNYRSCFLFRRIEPRGPAPKKQRHQLQQ